MQVSHKVWEVPKFVIIVLLECCTNWTITLSKRKGKGKNTKGEKPSSKNALKSYHLSCSHHLAAISGTTCFRHMTKVNRVEVWCVCVCVLGWYFGYENITFENLYLNTKTHKRECVCIMDNCDKVNVASWLPPKPPHIFPRLFQCQIYVYFMVENKTTDVLGISRNFANFTFSWSSAVFFLFHCSVAVYWIDGKQSYTWDRAPNKCQVLWEKRQMKKISGKQRNECVSQCNVRKPPYDNTIKLCKH